MTGIPWWQLGISRAAKSSPTTTLLKMTALLTMTFFMNSMESVRTFWMKMNDRIRTLAKLEI